MSNLVENPIVNDPYLEPTSHWDIDLQRIREPQLLAGRRAAQYTMARSNRQGRARMITHAPVELEMVNRIRERVKGWREAGYPGATAITRQLLQHWNRPIEEYLEQKQAEKDTGEGPAIATAGTRLFFCQREAAETIIWLAEAPAAERSGVVVPKSHPSATFERRAIKMATGAGKTVVMAMLAAWSICNKVANPQDARFSDAVLVVCPNLTVKDRLQVLYLNREGDEGEESYYSKFDVVPSHLRPLLSQGRVMVTNWHVFALQDDSTKRGVMNRGAESDTAFSRRVLGELDKKGAKAANLLVLNDEAHHAYRQYPLDREERRRQRQMPGVAVESDALYKRDEEQRARIWIEGLDRVQRIRGIRHCIDLSATPYFLKGSGRIEGQPFDWIVSDFGLLDAIESGIVKVPRIPKWDNSRREEPKYLRLYQNVRRHLPRSQRELTESGRAVALVQEVQGALLMLGSQWLDDLRTWEEAGREVPPAIIVICHNTATSELLARSIGEDGKALPELLNTADAPLNTVRIDSKLLRDQEIRSLNQTQEEAADEMREIVGSVGKRSRKGEQVRCVVSVGMLSEGWDAQNVTQILGLRAFSSPLLCEQVIGRGLRRFNYDDLSEPETVDVYGIPFDVLPMVKVGPGGSERQVTTVKSLREREKQFGMVFPRVVGYINDVKYRIAMEWDSVPEMLVTPTEAPTLAGVGDIRDAHSMPVEFHDRGEFYENNRVNTALFAIAARVTANLDDRHRLLFPQVLRAAREYYETKVKYESGVDRRELCLEKYVDLMANNLAGGIRSANGEETRLLRPILDPYRPTGSTSGVFFQTSLYCIGTQRSHISHIACHAKVWERDLAVALERHLAVLKYARNFRLDFTIPYEYQGQTHPYTPDFVVELRCSDGSVLHLVLEVKGLVTNRDRRKRGAALRWVDAVNNWSEMGRWAFYEIRDLSETESILDQYARGDRG